MRTGCESPCKRQAQLLPLRLPLLVPAKLLLLLDAAATSGRNLCTRAHHHCSLCRRLRAAGGGRSGEAAKQHRNQCVLCVQWENNPSSRLPIERMLAGRMADRVRVVGGAVGQRHSLGLPACRPNTVSDHLLIPQSFCCSCAAVAMPPVPNLHLPTYPPALFAFLTCLISTSLCVADSGSGLQHEVMTMLAQHRPRTLLDLLQPRICPPPPPGTQPSSAGKPPLHPVLQPIAVGVGACLHLSMQPSVPFTPCTGDVRCWRQARRLHCPTRHSTPPPLHPTLCLFWLQNS